MAVNRKFVAKYGLDNSATTIDNLGVAGATFGLAGANSVTLTSTGTTNVTLPTTGTLATTTDIKDGLLTLAVSGIGLTGGTTFSANQTSAATFTVTSNATSANTASAIVARDESNNFSAGIGTFAGSGTNSGITLSGTVTNATDATTKAYVDSVLAGLSWKTSVRAATTVAGTLATSFANGQAIDGVTLVTGNRILIKNQAAPAENGIYVVASSGAPTRATDADTGTELVNATVYVSEGTNNADTGWTQTANAPITIGTTGIVWAQFSGSGTGVSSFSAGTTGLTPSASTTGAITLGGTLIAANGGTGQSAYAIGDLLYASTTSALSRLADVAAGSYLRSGGVATAPVWSTTTLPNSATTGDLLFASAANTYTNLADVATGNALISGGVGVAPSWGKIGLTTHVSGTLAATSGGTGNASYAVGDILFASTTTALSRLADVATGSALISGGVGVAPAWGKISLTAAVSGILPLANGGSNANLTAVNGGIAYSTASAIALSAAGTSGQILQSNGAAAPTWTGTPTMSGINIITAGGVAVGEISGAYLLTSATTANQVVDAMPIASYRAMTYKIAVTSGSSYQYTEVYLLHDGTTVYITEITTMSTGTQLATFDGDILTGNMRLLVTPVNAVTTIKAVATGIAI